MKVKDLMKRFLNDLVINDTRWSDHNKKVKQETNLQNANKDTGLNWQLFCHQSRTLKALPQCPYFDCLTYNGSIYNGPTYEGQAKYFNPRNLSRFLNKSVVN